MGCLLIIGGIFAIAYSYGNSYLIALGVILIIWGGCGLSKEGKKPSGKNKTNNKNKTGSGSSDGGYDGHTYTGQGTPSSVHRGDGSDVDTYGYGWRDNGTGGRENVFTGESVEKDIYGNWSYTDSDGDTDDDASFDYDD